MRSCFCSPPELAQSCSQRTSSHPLKHHAIPEAPGILLRSPLLIGQVVFTRKIFSSLGICFHMVHNLLGLLGLWTPLFLGRHQETAQYLRLLSHVQNKLKLFRHGQVLFWVLLRQERDKPLMCSSGKTYFPKLVRTKWPFNILSNIHLTFNSLYIYHSPLLFQIHFLCLSLLIIFCFQCFGGLRRDFIILYNYLKEGWNEVGVCLLSQVTSDKSRGNGLKFCQGKCRLAI